MVSSPSYQLSNSHTRCIFHQTKIKMIFIHFPFSILCFRYVVMSSMLRNTNAKQGSKSKAGEYKLDASRWENRKLYYKKFRIKRKIRWWIPIDGVAFVFLWWRRAKNERRTGVLALRLWRGNQRRVTLYYISDLSFYKFWECAWKIFERKREEKAMGACVRLIDLRCI